MDCKNRISMDPRRRKVIVLCAMMPALGVAEQGFSRHYAGARFVNVLRFGWLTLMVLVLVYAISVLFQLKREGSL